MSSMMIRRCLTAVALAAMAAVVAFAPATSAEAAPSVSAFAGSWSGTWDIAAIEDHRGTFDWTISDAGRITGTVVYTATGDSGAIVGHVGTDGHIMMIGYAPNVEPTTGNGFPFQGTAGIDGDGKLVASMTGMFNAFPNNHVDDWLLATLERN